MQRLHVDGGLRRSGAAAEYLGRPFLKLRLPQAQNNPPSCITAARLFREKGYAGTTMREVADHCGIRAASLYYHFPAKDEILAEVFDYGVRHVADAVRALHAAFDLGAGGIKAERPFEAPV